MSFFDDVVKGLFGGSESRQQSRSNMDPRLMDAFLSNWRGAGGVADRLGRREVLPAGETFREGMDFLRGGATRGADLVSRGAAAAGDTIGRAPERVTAGRFGGEGFGRFLNPVTDTVVDRSLADLDRQREIAQQRVGDDAVAAGAFGGSRHGVVEAETNRGFADAAAHTSAELRSDAFDKAAGLQAAEFDRGMTADRANQAAGLTARGLDLEGAGMLGDFGELARSGGAVSGTALANLGLTARELEQEQRDADRQLELERQRIRNEALGIAPAGGAGKVSTASGRSDDGPGLLGGIGDFWSL